MCAVEGEEIGVRCEERAKRDALNGAREVVSLLESGAELIERRAAAQVVEAVEDGGYESAIVVVVARPGLGWHIILGHEAIERASARTPAGIAEAPPTREERRRVVEDRRRVGHGRRRVGPGRVADQGMVVREASEVIGGGRAAPARLLLLLLLVPRRRLPDDGRDCVAVVGDGPVERRVGEDVGGEESFAR